MPKFNLPSFSLPTLPDLVGYLPGALQVPVLTSILFAREMGHLALEKVGLTEPVGVDLVGKVEAPADAEIAVLPAKYVESDNSAADFSPVKRALLSGNTSGLSTWQKIAAAAAFALILNATPSEAFQLGDKSIFTVAVLGRIACIYEIFYFSLANLAAADGLLGLISCGKESIGDNILTGYENYRALMLATFLPAACDAGASFLQEWWTAYTDAEYVAKVLNGVKGAGASAVFAIITAIGVAFNFFPGAIGEWWPVKTMSIGGVELFNNWLSGALIFVPGTIYYLLLTSGNMNGLFKKGGVFHRMAFYLNEEGAAAKGKWITEVILKQSLMAILRGASFAALAYNTLGAPVYAALVFLGTTFIQFGWCAKTSLNAAYGTLKYDEKTQTFFRPSAGTSAPSAPVHYDPIAKITDCALAGLFGAGLGLLGSSWAGSFGEDIDTWGKWAGAMWNPLPIALTGTMTVIATILAVLEKTPAPADNISRPAYWLQFGSNAARMLQQIAYANVMYHRSKQADDPFLKGLFSFASLGITSAPMSMVIMACIFPFLWTPQSGQRAAMNQEAIDTLVKARGLTANESFNWKFIKTRDLEKRAPSDGLDEPDLSSPAAASAAGKASSCCARLFKGASTSGNDGVKNPLLEDPEAGAEAGYGTGAVDWAPTPKPRRCAIM